MSPRRKAPKPQPFVETETNAAPSSSFLGPDPVFEDDEEEPHAVEAKQEEEKPKPEPKPEPKLEVPPPLRTRVREEEFNKCLILFSREQLKALTEHLKRYKDGLNFEPRQDFEKGPLGQVLRNLG